MSQNNKEPTKWWGKSVAKWLIQNQKERIEELKEENKELKEQNKNLKENVLGDMKMSNGDMSNMILNMDDVIEELKKENKKLQEWKDNQKEMCGMDSWSEDSDSEDEINSNTPEKID